MVKIMENPIKMDDLGVPLFSETSIIRKKKKKKNMFQYVFHIFPHEQDDYEY